MRQIGTVATQTDAERFLAYLLTQRIEAQADPEQERWTIWVHDEDRVTTAKTALEEFLVDPNAVRYQDAKRQARTLAREEDEKRRAAQKNVVEMRTRWSSGAATARKAPLMLALCAIAVLVSLFAGTLNGDRAAGQDSSVLSALSFADRQAWRAQAIEAINSDKPLPSPFLSIARGQLWRLVTPIFIHFGVVHLLFNLFVFWRFAGQIEDHRSASKLAMLVIAIAVLSNVGQAIASGPNFGGMSGVVYGLFGYLWMRIRQGNVEGYQLSPGDTVILIGWFFLCIARQAMGADSSWLTAVPDNVANYAHAVGLVAGGGLALLPDPLAARGK